MSKMEQMALYQMKGIVSDLPQEDQDKIKEVHAQLKKLVADNGSAGFLALALLSLEISVEQG